ncbi:SAM-dependent methyltransferase [Streptomyces sp. HNM0575]|uniref:SAM-dependent methyltransferase n=1 Tax=Streptomyces sp. HNM0575 TaxID=2716338 RepID=UPI00145D5625|nr:SAM-dependent methyltransferase [Streptomyces sp. HNM0575]NLU75334.1 SAM-dependent methyltransferase [Streptomyces sp. HNM0575]
MTQSPTHGVALTAVAMANERRVETAREDRLVDDPLAGAFVDAAAPADGPFPWLQDGGTLSDLCPAMGDYVALRTRLFDDWTLRAVCEEGVRQVVLPAAGLDARAYRLSWPGDVRLFEIDFPELIAFKQETLAAVGARASCERTAVRADLDDDWESPLLDGGFRPEQPSLWLVEGLLMYLADDDGLLSRITALAAPGSRLIADHAYPEALRSEAFAAGTQTLAANGSAFGSTVTDPEAWLAGHGWSAALAEPSDLVGGTGRALPAVLDPAVPDSPVFWFALGRRG